MIVGGGEYCSSKLPDLTTAGTGGLRRRRRAEAAADVRAELRGSSGRRSAGWSVVEIGERRRRRGTDRRVAIGAGGPENWFWSAEKHQGEERERGRLVITCRCVRSALPTSAVSELAGDGCLVAAATVGRSRRLGLAQSELPVLPRRPDASFEARAAIRHFLGSAK